MCPDIFLDSFPFKIGYINILEVNRKEHLFEMKEKNRKKKEKN